MKLDNAVMVFAGVMVLAGTLLTWLVSPWFLLLTGFVGVNLLQAGLTGFCPAAAVFKRLGARPGAIFT